MQNHDATDAARDAARIGIDGAMKLGAQTAELVRTCASLQTESASQMLDESIRVSKQVLGENEARGAVQQWGRVWEQAMRGYVESTRSFQETALLSHAEMIKAAGSFFAAGNRMMADNLEKITREVKENSQAGARGAQQPQGLSQPQSGQQSHKRAA